MPVLGKRGPMALKQVRLRKNQDNSFPLLRRVRRAYVHFGHTSTNYNALWTHVHFLLRIGQSLPLRITFAYKSKKETHAWQPDGDPKQEMTKQEMMQNLRFFAYSRSAPPLIP